MWIDPNLLVDNERLTKEDDCCAKPAVDRVSIDGGRPPKFFITINTNGANREIGENVRRRARVRIPQTVR